MMIQQGLRTRALASWKRKFLVALLLVLCLGSLMFTGMPSSRAWGRTGHRVIARIAEKHIAPRTAAAIKELLGKSSLVEVATWSDEIKSDPRWRHANRWHWVSIADGKTYVEKPKQANGEPIDIIQAIRHFRAILRDKTGAKEKRVEALKWLVHLVGDIHQPLHVGRASDKGGNDTKAVWFDVKTNMHVIWDSALIDSTKLSFSELAGFIDKAEPKELRSWRSDSVLDWAQESYALRAQAYEAPRPSHSGSYGYAFKNIPVVKQRLLQAGIRLASLLDEIFDASETPVESGALHWVRSSAEYQGLAHQAYAACKLRLLTLEKSGELPPKGTWSVVLDADETILDNSLYQKERGALGYSLPTWEAWCVREEAQAVPGSVSFLKFVQSLGGRVAIVTNRRVQIEESTRSNLKKIGAPFDLLLSQVKSSNKGVRWRAVSQGIKGKFNPSEVLLFLGDSIGDFPIANPVTGKPNSNQFALFGTRFFLIPNPVYGRWQSLKMR